MRRPLLTQLFNIIPCVIWGCIGHWLCCSLLIAVAYADEKPLIVTTTSIVADSVRAVAGECCIVKSLMGPGVDPHLYRASHGDLKLLNQAVAIFYTGLHLEGKMQEVLQGIKKRKPVYAITSSIDVNRLRQPDEFAGQYDPHVWFDVALWAETIKAVEDGLTVLLPNQREVFRVRADKYRKELSELHTWVREMVESVPVHQRVLITAHDAFGYFGRAYGFEVAGLQGISTASEFGLRDVQRIVELVLERNIAALFIESSVPERFVASIQQGVAAGGGKVTIGGTLYSDALGDSASRADTYVGMVRHNVSTIVGALKGAP